MLRYVKAQELTNDILKHVDQVSSVLLFLSGGSAIEQEVAMLKSFSQSQKERITLSMVDERAVPYESVDSNWGSILQLYPEIEDEFDYITINPEKDPGEAAIELSTELNTVIVNFDQVIGIYGVGEDGHTAGMQPMDEDEFTERFLQPHVYACYYEGQDFPRVTTTNAVIKKLDHCLVYAVGKGKKSVLEDLQDEVPAHEMPSQLLKNAKKLTVYTDQIVTKD